MTLILASSSPRRSALLREAGYTFLVRTADIDETPRPGESAEALVLRLAHAKAAAVVPADDEIVLAADTTVACAGQILNKPVDEHEAAGMLRLLSGRPHEVFTGVALRGAAGTDVFSVRTVVWFAPMSDAEIRWYVASGEPMGKAGAYAIQGRASRFVTRVEGSYPNVVGLPVADVAKHLAKYGLAAS